MKGRIQAVGVVTDVTVITQQQSTRVTGLATCLAHCTLQTPPPFSQDDSCDLDTVANNDQITDYSV